jgi:hypothetical protein
LRQWLVPQSRLELWAGAGYVVAAPTFPLTRGAGRRDRRLCEPAGDVSFVIDELLAGVPCVAIRSTGTSMAVASASPDTH